MAGVSTFQSGVERVLAAATCSSRQQPARLSQVVHLGDADLHLPPDPSTSTSASTSSTSSPSTSARLLSRLLVLSPPPWLASPRATLLGGKRSTSGEGHPTHINDGETVTVAASSVHDDRSSSSSDSSFDPSLLHASVEASVSKQAIYIYSREVCALQKQYRI